MRPSRYSGVLLALSLFVTGCATIGTGSRLVDNLESGKQQTVITYGTSLTAGGAWVKQLQQALDSSYPGRAKVINSGKGAMWSTWGVDHLDKRVIEKKPDMILIEFAITMRTFPTRRLSSRPKATLTT